MKKASLITLGCKINQCESAVLMHILSDFGFEVTDGPAPADLYVLNTCAVTGEGERKSRQTLSKIKKLNPSANVVALGCACQRDASPFLKEENVVYVGGTADKFLRLSDYLSGEFSRSGEANFLLPTVFTPSPSAGKLKTRRVIKVQDGCNNFCSYCIVPYLRGRSRSRGQKDILDEISVCRSKEIVLSGIDLSSYGLDIGLTLVDLLRAVSDVTDARVRLGSLELSAVTEKFLEAMRPDRFCKQFHLSMQSGSDRVLRAMNRHYTSAEFLQKIASIRDCYPDANITTDVIAGFPTETEEEHRESLETARLAAFGDMHIFPYSLRSGTKAAALPQVEKSLRVRRAHEIEEVAAVSRRAYLESRLGVSCTVLTEQEEDGLVTGYSQHYVKVYLPSGTPTDTLVDVTPREPYRDGVR